jgi:riboflavin biosynthesis pyrimidine reductase
MAATEERALVGTTVPRKEDPELLTGQARYVDNLTVPGMVWAYVVRSPYAHARIRGVDLTAALTVLRTLGVRSLLVEGGARVITSFLAEKLVDRLVVGIAPTIMGAGIDAVGDLGVARVAESVRLTNRSVHQAGGDLLVAADVR